jgi:hypothetical protein
VLGAQVHRVLSSGSSDSVLKFIRLCPQVHQTSIPQVHHTLSSTSSHTLS